MGCTFQRYLEGIALVCDQDATRPGLGRGGEDSSDGHSDLPEMKVFHKSASVSFTNCVVMAVGDRLDTKLIFALDEVFPKTATDFQKHRINKKQHI